MHIVFTGAQRLVSLAALLATPCVAFAQPSAVSSLAPPANGPRRADSTWFAIADCTVHTKPGAAPVRGTVVVRDGRIQAILPASAGPDGVANTADDVPARVPVGPAIINAAGLHLYPAFIEPYAKVDTPAPVLPPSQQHWNPSITPTRSAISGPGLPEARASKLRELGFGAAAITPEGGIIAGTASVVSLSKPPSDASASKPPVYAEEVYQRVALETSRGGYPDSLMGSIAIIRQSFSDADWLQSLPASAIRDERVLQEQATSELAKTKQGKDQLFVFDANNELNVLRAAKIAKEFSRSAIIMGSGSEFARIDAIKATGLSFILPLNFPKAPDVASPEKADSTELRTMMTWEQAPTNPRRLANAGVPFALTTNRLRDAGELTKNVREAIRHGLAPDVAFASLTTTPASMLGVESQLGTIDAGKRANLIVTTGPLFDLASKDTKIRTVYIDGVSHVISEAPVSIDGSWDVSFVIAGTDKPVAAELDIDGNKATLHFDADEAKANEPGQAEPKQDAENKQDGAKEKSKRVSVQARKVEKSVRGISFVVDAPALTNALKHKQGEQAEADKQIDGNAKTESPLPAALVSLSFDAGEQPQTLSGQVWLPAEVQVGITGARSVRSLAGTWPLAQLTSGTAGLEQAVLRVANNGEVSIFSPFETLLSQASPSSTEWSDNTLTIQLPQDKGTLTLTPLWNDEPLAAIVEFDRGGTRTTSTISRREENPFAGKWRVASMDGKAIAANEPEQVHVTIESKVSGDSIVIERTLPKKEEQASKAKDKHTAKSSEAKLVDGVITFSHTLKDIGFDSTLVSSDTLKLRFASDAQGSLSVSSASRAKDAKQKDRIEGSSIVTDPSKPADAANPPSIHTYTLERVAPDDDLDTKPAKDIPESFGLPFGPFALEQPAQARLTLLVNGTLWTNTAKADENDIVPAGTLVLRDGKIVSMLTHEVGMSFVQALAAAKASVGGSEDALVIDCTGKHITPGLIDAHSHTGISQGVNEGGQAVTSEVRIQDVTNPDDVNWYRQLAGGVTSVLNLHGSANAIGGQSQVNKLRWGCAHPDDMHFVGAIPGIKFALGENPRQVNWDRGSDRYPKTRMGVETLIRDRFTAAREYAVAREKDPLNTRRDLELEALAEILAGKRLIHCHSYRQDEIVMLTHVARDFGFKIGTFQHILEGYKVADYVRDYSGGGSGFTDWWAFKQEVQDAIPAGLPLMQKVGATTSFNSDSNNLARFMNVEAAKAVRYGREVGGFTEAQALRFVTLNPAKQLRIDDRVGKLQNGYDADVVVWTRSPLSTFSLVEATFVDGKLLFSREMDAQARKRIASERDRLIAKLVEDPEAKKAREKKDRSPDGSQDADAKADDSELLADLGLTAEQAAHLRELYLRSLTSGRVPTDAPGLCGCGLPHAAWVQQR